jgi:hypothetical protein
MALSPVSASLVFVTLGFFDEVLDQQMRTIAFGLSLARQQHHHRFLGIKLCACIHQLLLLKYLDASMKLFSINRKRRYSPLLLLLLIFLLSSRLDISLVHQAPLKFFVAWQLKASTIAGLSPVHLVSHLRATTYRLSTFAGNDIIALRALGSERQILFPSTEESPSLNEAKFRRSLQNADNDNGEAVSTNYEVELNMFLFYVNEDSATKFKSEVARAGGASIVTTENSTTPLLSQFCQSVTSQVCCDANLCHCLCAFFPLSS